MAATLTRRLGRRCRQAGRHAYRSVRRSRAATVVAAVVVAVAIGTTAVTAGEAPTGSDRPAAPDHGHPMPDGMPGRMDAHRNW